MARRLSKELGEGRTNRGQSASSNFLPPTKNDGEVVSMIKAALAFSQFSYSWRLAVAPKFHLSSTILGVILNRQPVGSCIRSREQQQQLLLKYAGSPRQSRRGFMVVAGKRAIRISQLPYRFFSEPVIGTAACARELSEAALDANTEVRGPTCLTTQFRLQTPVPTSFYPARVFTVWPEFPKALASYETSSRVLLLEPSSVVVPARSGD
ncbi:hypothetical protein K0M31_009242 [Melipona bicolor]|uniref:Uncharacterized protein n=1 Tax=Melipona bicolor TaxID=60889 RepID=A0AA40KJK6_9HYME|nr:hypothetical protein K0M31_009242 [Melipona bicolor]